MVGARRVRPQHHFVQFTLALHLCALNDAVRQEAPERLVVHYHFRHGLILEDPLLSVVQKLLRVSAQL